MGEWWLTYFRVPVWSGSNCKNYVWSWQSTQMSECKMKGRARDLGGGGCGCVVIPFNRLNDKNKMKSLQHCKRSHVLNSARNWGKGSEGPCTLFSGGKWKCWVFKEHLQNLFHKQRKTSPQIKWNSYGYSQLSQDWFHSNLCFNALWNLKAPRWKLILECKGAPGPLQASQRSEFRQKGDESIPGTKTRFLLPVSLSEVFHRFSIASKGRTLISSQLYSWWSNLHVQKVHLSVYQPFLPSNPNMTQGQESAQVTLPNICPTCPATPLHLY